MPSIVYFQTMKITGASRDKKEIYWQESANGLHLVNDVTTSYLIIIFRKNIIWHSKCTKLTSDDCCIEFVQS